MQHDPAYVSQAQTYPVQDHTRLHQKPATYCSKCLDDVGMQAALPDAELKQRRLGNMQCSSTSAELVLWQQEHMQHAAACLQLPVPFATAAHLRCM
jgi:hypothetical protein